MRTSYRVSVVAVAAATAAALAACGSDEASDCYDGCASAADRAACVAACDGAADAGDSGGGESDGAPTDSGNADSGDDAGTDDTGSPDATEDTANDGTGSDDAAGPDADDAATDEGSDAVDPRPTADIDIVACYALAECFVFESSSTGDGEICFDRAIPELDRLARPVTECVTERCGDLAFDLASYVTCWRSECFDEMTRCDTIPLLVPECAPVAVCLDVCGKRDTACRDACIAGATSDTGARLAKGYDACVTNCYSGTGIPYEECVATQCAPIDLSCFGDDPTWDCAGVVECIDACFGDGFCIGQCYELAADGRVERAATAYTTCRADNGCTTGDAELDDLCVLEFCDTLRTYCFE